MVISRSDEQAKRRLLLANVKSENDTATQRVVSVASLPQITRRRDLVAARESRWRRRRHRYAVVCSLVRHLSAFRRRGEIQRDSAVCHVVLSDLAVWTASPPDLRDAVSRRRLEIYDAIAWHQ